MDTQNSLEVGLQSMVLAQNLCSDLNTGMQWHGHSRPFLESPFQYAESLQAFEFALHSCACARANGSVCHQIQ